MPVTVIQSAQVLQAGNGGEVLGEVVERPVVLVPVRLAEGLDAQAVLRVHEKVAPHVVKHDRIFRCVVVAELAPDDAQWLDLCERITVRDFRD